MSEKKSNGHGNLTYYIVGAIIVAVTTGIVAPKFAVKLEIGGEVFLRLLMMMVVPLVVFSVMNGILGLGDVRKLGKPGVCAVLYYMSTTVLAVATGLLIVNLIQPGTNTKLKEAQEKFNVAAAAYEANAINPDLKSALVDANATLLAVKAHIQEQIDESAESDEEVIEAKEKQAKQKLAADNLKEAEKVFTRNEEAFAAAEKNLKKIPEDAELKAQHSEAKKNLAKARKEKITAERESKKAGKEPSIGDIISNLVLMLFTTNLFDSAAKTNLLPLIVFSIVFAGMLTTLGDRVFAITRMVGQINEALMAFIMLLMKIAPLGIMCLVAARVGKAVAAGDLAGMLGQQSLYLATVIGGLVVHTFVTLFFLYWFFTRKNPITFFKNMSQAILTAFSTASSSATLPVTMECAITKAGVSKRSTEFVMPLGATINMDGTALYEAAAAIFIAQIYFPLSGHELTMGTQLLIAVTATLAAIGAAGIPEAGLFTMIIVLNAAGLPIEYLGMILMMDWLLDRFRTAVNCFGDSVGAAIIDTVMPEQEDETDDLKSEGVVA